MPSRKQRRRQAKERRHEYEVVYLDEEGNEVEPDEDDERDLRPAKPKPAQAAATPGKKPGTQRARQSGARPALNVNPPSWQKVFRRAAVFAPVMLLVLYFLDKNQGTSTMLVQFVVLLLLFVPFSYYLDDMMYRRHRKRIGDPVPPRERKPRAR